MSARGRWILSGAAGLVGLGAAGSLVLAYVMSPARDFNTTLGVVGGLIGALGFVVSTVAAVQAVRRTERDPVEGMARSLAREWEREAVLRGLDRPEPLKVRWGPTDRPVAETRTEESGDVIAIADVWRAHPARQLVIIGEPGAGKTSAALILVRRLLATRAEGDAVPVLLNVADWDPSADHLDTWLARRLEGQFGMRRKTAIGLVDRGRIVPILDGLDEMPRQNDVISALTDAVGTERPLVVTCRSVEYEELVGAVGAPLARATVVEIHRVEPVDAIAYLPAGQIDGEKRWRPVLDRLRDEPDGPLATALRTPLMVFLAREEYRRGDPAGLLGLSDVDAIEAALLAGYVSAVYRNRGPVRPDETAPQYSPIDVARWLVYLAKLTVGGRRPIRWWALDGAVGGLPTGEDPRRQSRRLSLLTVSILGPGVVLAVGPFLDGGKWDPLTTSFSVGMFLPILSGLFAAEDRRWDGTPTKQPRTFLRDVRGPLLAVLGCWTLATAIALTVGAQLLSAHWATLPSALVLALAGLLLSSSRAAFHLAAWRLSRRGLAPRRLMPFLEDAHRRGVLRQDGMDYQFRHARLAEHLAARTAQQNGPGAEAPGPSTNH